MADGESWKVQLDGVPETLLWNLYHRAHEASQPRPVLADPKAVELVQRIDYPFQETFGPANDWLAQGQALRVRSFDLAVRSFLAEHPDGTVVALAEGLETQYWRVDNGRARWLCVELPETAEVRRSLLPEEDRQRILARSALDLSWRDEVDPSRPVLVTAQGLLMYLRPPEVRELIAGCAERFGGGALVFDAVPRWFSARTLRGEMRTTAGNGYTTPPMPWGLDAGELQRVRTAHPAVAEVRALRLPRGRGLYYGAVAPVLGHVPAVRNLRPTMTAIARFS
ncbi:MULTISPECIES: class I SAM-dependent methyltransferase [Streptacidiphilus]|uniref:Class I SAM-dependent methyltransferase n=1 Tax=Streptacidiphilus cavernicola TaxID=3342716 RepID=A0ABV6UJT2_9ACTN|nr:class I SAM-dependent methyltransferase [Streptacidiphilus jeojiense]